MTLGGDPSRFSEKFCWGLSGPELGACNVGQGMLSLGTNVGRPLDSPACWSDPEPSVRLAGQPRPAGPFGARGIVPA